MPTRVSIHTVGSSFLADSLEEDETDKDNDVDHDL